MTTVVGDDAIVIRVLEKIELAVRRTATGCTWQDQRNVNNYLAGEIAKIIKDMQRG